MSGTVDLESMLGATAQGQAGTMPPPQAADAAQGMDLDAILGQVAKGAYKAPPAPAPKADSGDTTLGRMAGRILPNITTGIVGMANTPTRMVQGLSDLATEGVNYLTGGNTKAPQAGMKPPAMEPARNTTEAVTDAVERALPGAALMGAGAARTVMPIAAGAVTGELAGEAVPEQYKPAAEAAGNFLGAGLGAGAQEGVASGVRSVGQVAGRMGVGRKQTVATPSGDIRATQAQQNAAAQQLYHAGGEDLRGALNQPRSSIFAPGEVVPGDQPTTAQLAPTPGVIGMQKAVAQRPDENFGGPAFEQRYQDQNTARLASIQGQAPAEVNPASLGDHVAAQLSALEDQGQRAVAGASEGVQGQTSALGGLGAPEERGAALRAGPEGQYSATHPQVSALWQAVDPTGTLGIHIGPLKQAQADLAGEMNPLTGDTLHGAETGVFNGVSKLPDVVSFKTLSAIRKNIGAAQRAIGGMPDQSGVGPQAMRRLTILKNGVDQSIADTVNLVGDREASQVAAGVLAPEDSMLGRLTQAIQGNDAGTEAASGRNFPPGANAHEGADLSGGGAIRSAPLGAEVSAGGNARSPARSAGLPGKAGPSLVSFLRSNGGLQDQGGDLAAMDAGRGLIKPNGLTLDHAREIAAEEGYLQPGSDINALLNAIDREIRGNKVFTTADDVANQQRQTARTAGGRSDHARQQAQFAVSEAESGLGMRLSQEEHDYASQLVGDGMHPEEAIRQATRDTDEHVLNSDVSRQAFGKPGVPAGAEQGEMGAKPPAMAPSFDAAAAERYSNARAATLNEKQTYGQGVVGKLLQSGKGGAEHAVSDAKVPSTLLNGRPDEAVGVGEFLKAGGSVEALKQALVGDLRDKGIIDSEGMVKPSLDKWVQKHLRTIEQVPGLGDQFKSVASAQAMVDDLAASHAGAVKEYRNGIAKNFLNGEEPEVAVRKALSGQDAARNLNKLIDLVKGDKDATESLKAHVVQFILDKFAPTGKATASMEAEAGDHSFLNANGYKAWIDANKAPLRKLFGGQGLQNFEMVAMALRRQQFRPNAVAGSQTSPNMLNAAKHAIGKHGGAGIGITLMGLLGEHMGEMAGEHGMIGMGLSIGAGMLMHRLRAAGIETVNDLKGAAMLHPELARELMARVGPNGKIGPMAGKRLLNVLRSMSAANLDGKETRH